MKFKIFKTEIYIDFYFITICLIFLMNSKNEFIIAAFLSFIHEMGHIICMKIYKISISKIKITPFSVDIIQNSSSLSYKKELNILLAGPFVNILVFSTFLVLHKIYTLNLFKTIYSQSLFIGVINLVPISSLDGGRILSIFLKNRFGLSSANKLSFIVSIIFIIPLMTSGFLVLIKSNFNISILLLSIYLSYFLIFQKWDDKKNLIEK